jgi:hypothetical protein
MKPKGSKPRLREKSPEAEKGTIREWEKAKAEGDKLAADIADAFVRRLNKNVLQDKLTS